MTSRTKEQSPAFDRGNLSALFGKAKFGVAEIDPLTGEIDYQNQKFATLLCGAESVLPEVIEQLRSTPRIHRAVRDSDQGVALSVLQFWGHAIDDSPESSFLLFVDSPDHVSEEAEDLRQLNLAVENAMQGISQLDVEGNFVRVKPQYAKMLGYEPNELVGQSWRMTVPVEDQPVALESYLEMLRSGRAEVECLACRKDGSTFFKQLLLVKIVDTEGDHTGHYCFMRDVTEKKDAEISLRDSESRLSAQLAELEAVYRTAPVGLCLIDTNLRFVRINEKLAEMHGRPVEDHIGRELGEILPDMIDLLEPIYRCTLDSGKSVSNLELERVDPSNRGVSHTFLASFFPLRNEKMETIGVSTVVQDITARRQTEQEIRDHHNLIREMDAQLAHVSRLSTMGEMVAGIAHEIHQPLAAIANYASACRRTLGTPNDESEFPLQGWLQQISDQAMRCGNIIRRQREFVRKGEGRREPVDIDLVLQNSVALIACDARSHMIDARPIVPGLHVHADSVELQQVIVNLIRNALDATSRMPEPWVRVMSEQVQDNVLIIVEDNGPGIDVAQHEKLFDAFYSTKRNGIGMGLAISKSIAESHDGTLRADLDCDRGARFILTLPLCRSDK